MSDDDTKNKVKKTSSVAEEAHYENQESSFLDLGLGSLLRESSDLEVDPARLHSSNDPDCPPGGVAESAKAMVMDALDEYQKLAHASDWTKIIALAETILENQAEKSLASERWIEAQAWWVIAQLRLNGLPPSILLAPMEGLLELYANHGASKGTQSSKSQEKLLELTKTASADLADSLFSQRDYLSGLQLLSRSRMFVRETGGLRKVLEKHQSELANLSGSDAKYYSIVCRELGYEPSRMQSSSRGSSEELLAKGTTNPARKFTRADTNRENKFFSAGEAESEKNLSTKNVNPRNYTIILLVVLISLLVYLFLESGDESSSKKFPALSQKVDFPVASLELPTPAAIGKFSELDAVLYGMQSKPSDSLQAQLPEAMPPAINSANNQQIRENFAKPEPTQRPKVMLDTQGPLENEEIRDLRERAHAASVASEQRDRGGNERGTGSDGSNNSIAIPGPAIAPRFEEFRNPRVYEIIRPTNLMKKPSLNSDPVAGLSKGDQVKVEGQEGYWLRVVSKQGKIAYVIAEDAQPQ